MNTPSNPHYGLTPSPWIARFAHLVPAGAQVLDLACGYGRHARFFAARGAHVLAVDRDAAALATMAGTPGIDIRQADVEGEPWPFGDRRFDAIVVSHYLHRPLFPNLRAALTPDGALLYETFALGNEVHGRPSNPDFLLRARRTAWVCDVRAPTADGGRLRTGPGRAGRSPGGHAADRRRRTRARLAAGPGFESRGLGNAVATSRSKAAKACTAPLG